MPALADLGLLVNPSTDPIRYPGAPVEQSCLVTESWLYSLRAHPDQPVGAWETTVDGGPLAELGLADRPLDRILEAFELPPVLARHPVLAVGSNAAPGQLVHKYQHQHEVSPVVPLTRVTARGIAVAHAAHVSVAGYIPYAPVADVPTSERDLFVLWLDDGQLARLHETERNYHPTQVSGVDYPAVLESGKSIDRYVLYRSRSGLLSTTPGGPPVPATTQAEVVQLLVKLPWFVSLVPESQSGASAAITALASDEDRRVAVRQAIADDGLVAPDRIDPAPSLESNSIDIEDWRPAEASRPEPPPVVAAIVTCDLGVLVGRRNDGKPPWTFIAGEIGPGESPADAAVREVKEETGLHVRVAEREIGRRVHPKTGRTMIYLACYPEGRTDVFVGDPVELAEVRWAGLTAADALLPGMYEPVRRHLAQELG